MNTATEFAQSEPEIAEDITLSIGRFRDVLRAAVERAQREGDISPERHAGMLANYLITIMSGLKTQAKAGVGAKTLRGIIAEAIKVLD